MEAKQTAYPSTPPTDKETESHEGEHKNMSEAVRSGFPMANSPWMGGQGENNDVTEWTAEGSAASEPLDHGAAKDQIVAVLKTVFDPEIPVNIYDLGLIYGMKVSENGEVEVQMTLTAPGCPVAGALVREVAEKSASVPGVVRSHVSLTWEPAWNMDMMTEEARLELGLL